MANKHSRQGLALGVSLVMGATTLGVLPAQAVDYENLEFTIAADDTNGVLATTMENDFELELEWEISNASDLAHLKYEVTFMSSDESAIDAKGSATGISWDAENDDIVEVAEYDNFDNNAFAHEGSDIISAPAHIIGDDAVVDYTRTVTIASETGSAANIVCTAGSDVIEAADSNNPPTSYTYRLNVNRFDDTTDPDSPTDEFSWTKSGGTVVTSDNSAWIAGATAGLAVCPPAAAGDQAEGQNEDRYRDYNVEYSAGTGFAGSLDEPAPSTFESVLWLESVSSVDDYVDVVVEAWLDKDGDNVKDSTESYAAPVTVRFWNPTALTPALELDDEGVVWGNDDAVDYTVYLTQELNDVYTTALTNVDTAFFAFSDFDYASIRDGHVYRPTVQEADNLTFGFDNDSEPTFEGKHLFETGTLVAEDASRTFVGVGDRNSLATDDYFSVDALNVNEIVAGLIQVNFQDRTVDHFQGLLVEQTLAWSEDTISNGYSANSEYYRTGDSFIHESVTDIEFVITAYEDTAEEDVVAGVDVVVTGNYYDGVNDDELDSDVTINGVSIIDEDAADADSGTFTVEGTTNAAGQLVLSISVENPTSGLYIDLVSIEAQGLANWDVDGVESGAAELDWAASNWGLVAELNAGWDNDYRHVTVGESVQVVYDVRDQWLQSPANGTAKVEFDFNNASLGNTRDYDGYLGDGVAVTNGRVSVTIPDVDADAGEGSIEVHADLHVKQSNGLYSNTADNSDVITLDYLDDAAVAEITLTDTTAESADVAYTDFWTVDFERTRMNADLFEAVKGAWNGDGTDNWDAGIHGYLESADGVELEGQKVTVSGAGLMFAEFDSSTDTFSGLWAQDSLTVFTNDYDSAEGFDVHVFGQEVGIHTITITAGGKSTTVDFCVGNWEVDEDGNDICVSPDNVRAHNVAITSEFAAKAGTADTLTALVTDRYGNVTEGETVTFSKVAGSGYIQEANGTVTTDEDGVATATLIILSGEIGFNSTVRAAITQDDFAATSNSAAAQRSAGDTNVGKTTAWTKLQTDGTAKMYAKNIVGAGKVQFFHNNNEIAWVRAADALNPKLRAANGAFYLVRTVELVAGKNVLEVYIDGERVRRTAYSK